MALALRRFDNIKSSPQAAAEVADRWKHATHPNIIQLHGAWVHQRALFFTHDYYPGAQTLQERYLLQRGTLIPEPTLWAYICQLVTALRAIHALGLACRVIHSLRVLWTSPKRIRINCVGVLDVLESESQKTLEELQREDIFKLGTLILELCTRLPIEHLQRIGIQEALDGVSQHYSGEVVDLIKLLMVWLCRLIYVIFVVKYLYFSYQQLLLFLLLLLHIHLYYFINSKISNLSMMCVPC